MHISFDKKKPQFGKVAEEIIAKHGKYGVQDLIPIMSEGNKAPTTVSPLGYIFTKAASPEFLFAMLLREQLKVIEKEMGEKPTKLGFCIFDVYGKKEMNNVQTAIGKACELIKIKDFCFVPWK
uniref:Uncharacterized protein n=1 Tax=Panagrolaimus davidi TaxID=227884 RepID=A0A914PQY4_9BILA